MKEVFQLLLFSAGMQMKTEGMIYPRPQNSASPKAMQCTPSRALINVTLSPVLIIVVAALQHCWQNRVVLPKEIVVIFAVYMNGPKTSFCRV